ncbi:hypothetical protein BSKO_00180 [Bryopsis sp. KO-2023]|nr:hypothetical protein BSKO_00180 [Bryopsis sp. KO-2023]
MEFMAKGGLTKLTDEEVEAITLEEFKEFAATRIQCAFRGHVWRKEFLTVRGAVVTIQRSWRYYIPRRDAARKIQNAWRGIRNRRVYEYYRSLIRFREEGDPKILLKCVNPKEAGLVDAAAGVHVRLRLGGETFPPMIYYKIFTHRPIADVCSFGPRNYSQEIDPMPRLSITNLTPRQAASALYSYPEDWYHRNDNNAWRPIAKQILVEDSDIGQGGGSDYRKTWCCLSTVRQEQIAKIRKEKKRKWWMKVYQEGKMEEGKDGGGRLADIPEESEQLLDWCEHLNFDSYIRDWFALGQTEGSEQSIPIPESEDLEPIPISGYNFEQMCSLFDAPLSPHMGALV